MSIRSRYLLLISAVILCSGNAHAGVDIITSASLGIPTGGLKDYSFGAVGVGATLRVSSNVNGYLKWFLQGQVVDFGVEEGFVPRDNHFSDARLETATDSYIISVMPGVSFGRNLGGIIPYFSLSGGMGYCASLSRIHSPDITDLTTEMESSGASWRVAAGFGVRTMLWEPGNGNGKRWLDAVYADLRFDIHAGGDVEYMDNRSVRFRQGELHFSNVETDSNLFMLNIGLDWRF